MEQQVNSNESSEKVSKTEQSPVEAHPAGDTSKSFISKQLMAVVLILVGAIGVVLYIVSEKDGQQNIFAVTGDVSEISITVDGNKVPDADIERAITQAQQAAVQQGLDPNDSEVRAQIETQALDVLINTQLLRQAADEEGITVTSEQIDEQVLILEGQFGGSEAFQAQLDSLGLTNENVRTDLEEQISIDTYIRGTDEFTELTVTDNEANEAYATFLLQNPEMPPFEEIAEEIKAQLLTQKQQIAVATVIDRLRTDAEIETSI